MLGLRSGLNATRAAASGVQVQVMTRAFTASAVSFKSKYPADLPKAPKGPITAFGLFLKKHYADQRATKGDNGEKINVTQVMNEVGDIWKNKLASSEKQTFEAEAAEDKKRYDAEYLQFYESLDKESIRRIKKFTGNSVRKPGGKVAWNQSQRASGLARPNPPYIRYYREFLASSEAQGLPMADSAKKAGANWKSMPDAQKKKYKDEYDAEFAKFKQASS
ncbi:hypothetical protein BCR39DRAFT_522391 [Naematelia encephala]|uniref:HMG box domain-containing protein n=1 Tax=Naematelia encephala TaxID=71784 RepID=A0A1Y2BDM6_9TREE|nr:hypothetical protein BCR39DRAFT_522391 [Naematelia encephala]